MKQQATISKFSTVVAASDQTSTGIPGETVILNVKTGMYYGMDEVGARVWDLIQTPKSVEEIQQVVLEDYETTPEQCERDLLVLLQELSAAGLIEVKDAAD